MSTERRRWAIFTNSIISDHENPGARFYRALGNSFNRRGHEATFFENRGNNAVQTLLKNSGAKAIDEFRKAHPSIAYRTLTPVSGHKLVEALLRDLSTIDIAIIDRHAPQEYVEWVGQLTRYFLTTVLVDLGDNEQGSPHPVPKEHIEAYTGIVLRNNEFRPEYVGIEPEEKIHRLELSNLDESDQSAADELINSCERIADRARNRFLHQLN